MPTGYTADLCDHEVDFATFVLGCARAFGATIHQRDEPASNPPRHREPSDYHVKAAADARMRLGVLRSASDEDMEQAAADEYRDGMQHYERSHRTATECRDRLLRMFRRVEAWQPPTDEHAELKTFMLDQLRSTVDFDGKSHATRPTRRTGAEYRAAELERAQRDLEYHEAEHAKEVQRCREVNQWIDDLVASLGGVPV